MYCVRHVHINKHDPAFIWCDQIAHLANNLYNAALFRERQLITVSKKELSEAHEHELEVLEELDFAENIRKDRWHISPCGMISYKDLVFLMNATQNPDYFAIGLPRQTAEAVLKQVVHDLKSYYAALREYRKKPDKFTGKPRMPHYSRRQGCASFNLTNQDTVIKVNRKGNYYAKLPLTKITIPLGKHVPGRLKEVHVMPANGVFVMDFVLDTGEEAPAVTKHPKRIAAIDLGVDNLMAVTNNIGVPSLLYNGKPLKSINQYYNKCIANMVSEATRHTTDKYVPSPGYLKVTRNRNNQVDDYLLKTGKHFMMWCVENRIDTIVAGSTPFWKQSVNLGRITNQSFVQIPFARLKNILKYMAERCGILYLEQEESYTSKASFPDSDEIPVYGEESAEQMCFSGKRVKRGLYCSADGTKINADLNGSANIMRKCLPDAFDHACALDFINIQVIKHPDIALRS